MQKSAYNIADLVGLSSEELGNLLREETAKPDPDNDLVLTILHILWEREKDLPLELTPREEEAAAAYRRSVAARNRKHLALRRWVVSTVSAAMVILVLLVAVPQKAQAETFWEMLQRWSDNFLEILNPREHISSYDYHFETDNPGLQQVYDAVVELGVTDPVVPMWLPDGYELVEFEVKYTPMLKGLWAVFSNQVDEVLYRIDCYDGEPAHQFYRDDAHYEEYEKNGTNFYVTQNNGSWVAVWTKESIECSISIDCQEETLRRVLKSIFEMEDY